MAYSYRPQFSPYADETAEAREDRIDPAARNWRTAHFGAVQADGSHGGRGANDSQWAGYFDVLRDRGAHLNPNADVAAPSLPAGYTQGQLDQETDDYFTAGRQPGYANTKNLPASQQAIARSLDPYAKSKDKQVNGALGSLYNSMYNSSRRF